MEPITKSILIDNTEAQELIELHDEWAGSINPDQKDDFLYEYNHLKLKLKAQGYTFTYPIIKD